MRIRALEDIDISPIVAIDEKIGGRYRLRLKYELLPLLVIHLLALGVIDRIKFWIAIFAVVQPPLREPR